MSLGLAVKSKIEENFKTVLLLVFLTIVLLFSYLQFGTNIPVIVGLSLIPLLFIISLNYWLTFSLLLLSVFIKFDYAWYTTGVWFSFIFIASYFITHRNIQRADFSLPITIPLVIYLFSIVPSYFMSIRPLFSIYLSYNLVSIILLTYLISSSFTEERIKYTSRIFFIFLFINALQVIYQGAVIRERAFGVAGVMFVDYVGIGIVILSALLIFSEKVFNRLFLSSLLFIFLLSSLLTQTRNSWISIALSLLSLLIYLIFKAGNFNLNRKLLIFILVFFVGVLAGGYVLVQKINPEVAQRTEETTDFKNSISSTGKVENTLVTRLFIWGTAFNMIQKHPILGVGAYSFPITSKYYYTIPKILYQKYVKGRTPHITFLAVLVETGIVGLIGFMFFIISVLVIVMRTIRLAVKKTDKIRTIILTWIFIYIFISMFMTDAWIWGQGAIVFGIVLGLNLANRRNLLALKSQQDG